MKQLLIDTATTRLSVALSEMDTIVAETTVAVSKNHAVTLMPAIEQLMALVNWSPKQLERIVVTTGPGSYTGIRIGVTAAKTLAYTLNVPLIGVSSLRLMAAAASGKGEVVALIDARRGNAYIGHYANDRVLTNDCHDAVDAWLKQNVKGPFTVVGDVEPFRDALAAYTYNELPAGEYARAGLLLKLAGDEPEDVHAFEPTYLRMTEAEAKWLEARRHD